MSTKTPVIGFKERGGNVKKYITEVQVAEVLLLGEKTSK